MLHVWCYYCIFNMVHLKSWEVFSSISSWFYSLLYHNNNIEHFFWCLLPMLTPSFLNWLFKIFVYFLLDFPHHFIIELKDIFTTNYIHFLRKTEGTIDDQGDSKCKRKIKVCNSGIHNYSEGAIGFWVEWHKILFISEL